MTKKRVPYSVRREQIKARIERIGPKNVNKSALAKEFGVSRTTIYEDWEIVLATLPPETLTEAAWNLQDTLTRSLKILNKEMGSADSSADRIRAASAVPAVAREYIHMLESFGIKEKIPDKVLTLGLNLDYSLPDDRRNELLIMLREHRPDLLSEEIEVEE